MALSRDEQRKKNRERMARARQRNVDATLPIDPQDELGQIEIVVPPEGPKPTLKDKLFGDTLKNPGTPAPAPVKRSSKKEDNLISTVLPTIIATFIATYAQQMLPEPYKACAPSQQECSAIFSPLMAMIGRRVQVAGKVSQDVIDFTNSLLAGIGFGVRSYVTYVQITNRIVDSTKGASLEEEKPSHPRKQRERSSKQRSEEADTRASDLSQGRIVEDIGPTANHIVDVPDSGSGSEGDGEQEARAVASLLARDRRGREQLKLI